MARATKQSEKNEEISAWRRSPSSTVAKKSKAAGKWHENEKKKIGSINQRQKRMRLEIISEKRQQAEIRI